MELVDRDTGEIHKAHVSVACLPYSAYLYAEGFLRMDQEAWLTAHINAFEHFGGTTPLIVPDNLKTGVTRNDCDELIIDESKAFPSCRCRVGLTVHQQAHKTVEKRELLCP